ncbi:hypothetical protein [Nonomuraea guangzhouensis]|uniref:Transcriptional regulator n=1 Tax=Nonomuraea guangzhouensis TaxID=1291555 RepID=A0ABW4GWB6_9ACTN|nr:hypothetical protein [Nonomuraea guangzhouensis]
MTPPVRHNAKQAGAIVGKSQSWMYQKGAAGAIPRTKIGHHVSWTDEQLTQIIRDGAQQPKQPEPQPERSKPKQQPAKPKVQRKPKPAASTNTANVPVADWTVSRLYRDGGAK